MENCIKVGKYIRVNNDNRNCIGIGKVTRIVNESIYVNINNKYNLPVCFQMNNIVKHSKNLIDLIEVGDFVNGMQVLDVYKPRDLWEPIEIRVDSRYTNFILAEDIKTILTKEQMMANCYKVGGEDDGKGTNNK